MQDRSLGRLIPLCLFASGLLGCADFKSFDRVKADANDQENARTNESCAARTSQLRALTFNAALAPGFEPITTERLPLVLQALSNASKATDLMCVQEFWIQQHFEMLRANILELPYVLRMAPKPGSGSCSIDEIAPLTACLSTNCPDATSAELVGCATRACTSEVVSVSGGCLGCILNNLGEMSTCVTSQQAISDPAVFDGAFDVGLFSRWPIVHSEYRELSSYFVRASVLHARVLMPGFAPIDAFCTHLGSPLGVIPYRGKYGSWEGEHLQQVKEILEFVREKSNDDRPLLLLGDFNMGPKTALSDPVWERHYWMTIGAGLDNAYLSGGSARCTSCAGTTFRDSSATNQLIDHVFSMGLSTRNSKWERLFDVPVAITHDVPAFNLSDHTGLRVTFSRSDQH